MKSERKEKKRWNRNTNNIFETHADESNMLYNELSVMVVAQTLDTIIKHIYIYDIYRIFLGIPR